MQLKDVFLSQDIITELPIASKETTGCVKIGDNVTVNEEGEISVYVPSKVSELENDSEYVDKEYISGVESKVETIESKIPEQADENNKLADKDFVNSSIATNTAYFKGTYNYLSDLEEIPLSDITNNDYAFVISTDISGNTQYNRFKFTRELSAWGYEYTLNNSSFTSDQWKTINSGITSSDVSTITDLKDWKDGLHIRILSGLYVDDTPFKFEIYTNN